jgi:uncharacterized membrane protein YjfL (UPF0719 family)
MLQVVVVVFMTTVITYLILRLLLLNLQLKLNSTRVSVGLYLLGYHSLCLLISVFTTQDISTRVPTL